MNVSKDGNVRIQKIERSSTIWCIDNTTQNTNGNLLHNEQILFKNVTKPKMPQYGI